MYHKTKYNRYQLTYPSEGNIYQTRSFKKAIQKCYNDFKQSNNLLSNNLLGGEFIVSNLDSKTEYKFKVNENKLKKCQMGGFENPSKKQEDIILELNLPKEQGKFQETVKIDIPETPGIATVKPVIQQIPQSEASKNLEELENEIEETAILPTVENMPNIDELIDKKLSNIYGNITETAKEIKNINEKIEILLRKEIPKLTEGSEIEVIPSKEKIEIDINEPKITQIPKVSPIPTIIEPSVSIKIDEVNKCSYPDAYSQAIKQLETLQYMKQLEKNEIDFCIII
jgi:hypothetical protein